jgi:hypothetical protein
MDDFEVLLKDYLSDPRNNSEVEHEGAVKSIYRHYEEDGRWHVTYNFPGCSEDRKVTVSKEELFGWMWVQMKSAKALSA